MVLTSERFYTSRSQSLSLPTNNRPISQHAARAEIIRPWKCLFKFWCRFSCQSICSGQISVWEDISWPRLSFLVSSRHKVCFPPVVPCIFWPFIPAWEMLRTHLICTSHPFCTAEKDYTSVKYQTIPHKLYQGNTAAGQSACVSWLWFICTKEWIPSEEWRIYHTLFG